MRAKGSSEDAADAGAVSGAVYGDGDGQWCGLGPPGASSLSPARRLLVESHAARAGRLALARAREMGLDEEDALSASMEALVRAGISWDPSRGSPFGAHLATCVRRACVDVHRRRCSGVAGRRAPPAAVEGLEAADEPTVGAGASGASGGGVDLSRVPGLGADRRRVLELYAVGLTMAQIAARTGAPVGTVRSRFHRAKAAVRAAAAAGILGETVNGETVR